MVPQAGYSEWVNKSLATGDPGTSVLRRLLYLSLTNDARYQEICSLLGPEGRRATQVLVRPLQPPEASESGKQDVKWYWIAFQPTPQSLFFDFAQMSAGTQRVLRSSCLADLRPIERDVGRASGGIDPPRVF